MQHLGEPWVSVQMRADPLISDGLFNIKHGGSWQELRAEPANTLTSWSELCLWILLPLGTQWLHWDLPGCGNLQARAGQQQWALVKRRNWGKNLVPFSDKAALKQHTKSIFSEPWKTWLTRGHDFSLQAVRPFPGTSAFSSTLSCWWCFFQVVSFAFLFPLMSLFICLKYVSSQKSNK